MMNKDNIIQELNELKEQGLIKDFKLVNDIIEIITLDEYSIDIETNFMTYYKLVKSSCNDHITSYNKIYESFEQLLSHLSNGYNKKFSDLLYNKLLALSKKQEEDDNLN